MIPAMTLHHRFAPDGRRARALDHAMHRALAESLMHIVERCRGTIDIDEAALLRIADGLRSGARHLPPTFGLYYEAAGALLDGRNDDAERLLAALARERPIDPVRDELRVLALGEPALAAHTERYQRMMESDPTSPFPFLPPPPDTAAAFRARFQRGFALLERAAPELASEVRAIVSEVILAVGTPMGGYTFDGGSSYQLWGGLFLNAESHETDVAIVELVAHESAHSLLFGFTIDELLVENPADELFDSPLRRDPRPMDGIYHATFVSARMHWAMSRLLDAGVLDDAATAEAQKARATDRENFEAGYDVVARHGRLSPTGTVLMDGARGYMDGAG